MVSPFSLCLGSEKSGNKIVWDFKGDYSFESGERAFQSIHKKNISGAGVFASNDQMAVGFIHAALENNVNIPGDYYVIGYDNILFSKIFYPKLTTINTNVDQLSTESLGHLVRLINGQNNLDGSPKKTLIPVNLVTRNTHRKK